MARIQERELAARDHFCISLSHSVMFTYVVLFQIHLFIFSLQLAALTVSDQKRLYNYNTCSLKSIRVHFVGRKSFMCISITNFNILRTANNKLVV